MQLMPPLTPIGCLQLWLPSSTGVKKNSTGRSEYDKQKVLLVRHLAKSAPVQVVCSCRKTEAYIRATESQLSRQQNWGTAASRFLKRE